MAIQIIEAQEAFPDTVNQSIFLAGPSPRQEQYDSWREDMIFSLEQAGFDGHIYIPIAFNRELKGEDSYINQIAWEEEARERADVILFWVDRNIEEGFLGLTTNTEFGMDLATSKVFYGRPDSSDKVRYLDKMYQKFLVSSGRRTKSGCIANSMRQIADDVVDYLNSFKKTERTGGETYIPLHVWNLPNIQSWYKSLLESGHKLESAKVRYEFMRRNNLFLVTLHPKIWIPEENRYKGNEIIISRRDISSILAYTDDEVVLVKEFRSPVNNKEGYVYELAGGSSFDEGMNPLENAREEFWEEVGVYISDINRFHKLDERQLLSTVSTHKAHLYGIKLEKEEMEKIKEIAKIKEKQTVILDDDEHTYIIVSKKEDIAKLPIDFATMGMICSQIN